MKKQNTEDIENKFKELFYFNEKSNSKNQFDGKMKEWTPIPETPVMAYNIEKYGNFDIDKCGMFTKKITHNLNQISYFNIMYSKLFSINVFYNNYNKKLIFCSDINKALREMVSFLSSPNYQIPTDLIGSLIKTFEFVENDNECAIESFRNMDRKKQIDTITYLSSKFYIRSYINSRIGTFLDGFNFEPKYYKASDLNICMSYLITYIVYSFMISSIKFLQLSFECKNGLTDGISKMIKGVEYIDSNVPGFNECYSKCCNQMYQFSFTIIINNSKKYFNKIFRTEDISDGPNCYFSKHQLFDMNDTLYVLYNMLHTDGTLLDNDGIDICNRLIDINKLMKFDYLNFTNINNYNNDNLKNYDFIRKYHDKSFLIKMILFLSKFMTETESKNKNLIDKFLKFRFEDPDADEDLIEENVMTFNSEFSKDDLKQLAMIKSDMENQIIQAMYCAMGECFCSTSIETKDYNYDLSYEV